MRVIQGHVFLFNAPEVETGLGKAQGVDSVVRSFSRVSWPKVKSLMNPVQAFF